MDGIVIKECDESDKSHCVNLLKATFAGSNEATFAWRFETTNVNKPILICAKHGDRVVSFNSWIPWEFSFDGGKYLGYQSGESATDRDYRGRGLFGKVLRFGEQVASARGIDFLFGFPSRMSFGPIYKAGYTPICTYYYRIRPVSPFRKEIDGAANITSDYPFDSMLTQPSRITPLIDYGYFKWRFVDNPKDYEIVEYSEYSSKALFLFRKRKWKRLTELILLDVQFNNFNETFVKDAVAHVERCFSKKAVLMRTFINEHSDRGRAVGKQFFIKVKSRNYILIVKALEGSRLDSRILLNCNSWDMMPHCVDEL